MKPYFEYVDIPNLKELSDDLLKIVPQAAWEGTPVITYSSDSFLKEVCGLVETVEMIRPWNELGTIALITMFPDMPALVHVDGPSDDSNPGVAFNIPVFNCAHSIIYERVNNAQPNLQFTPDTNVPYRTFELDQVQQIAMIDYNNRGVLINTDKPHKIEMQENLPRIVLSFRWDPPIKW